RLPGAARDLPSAEPALSQHRRALPRCLGAGRRRVPARARRPRPRARRPRQRRRRRSRDQQHGRRADGAGEPAADRPALGGRPGNRTAAEPLRDRRGRDGRVGRAPADARDPIGRHVSLAGRPARVLRTRRLDRAGRRGGADAGRRPLALDRTGARQAARPRAHERDARRARKGADGPMTRQLQSRRLLRACAAVLLAVAALAEPHAAHGPADPPAADGGASDVYRPELAVPEMLEPYLPYVEPGDDAFPLERDAEAIESRLQELGDALRAGRPDDARALLAPDVRGAALLPALDHPAQTSGPLEIR